jgi:hypothetical protein
MLQEHSGRKIQFGQIDCGDLDMHRNLSWINAIRRHEYEIACFIRPVPRNMSSFPLIIKWFIYRQIPVVLTWYLYSEVLSIDACVSWWSDPAVFNGSICRAANVIQDSASICIHWRRSINC